MYWQITAHINRDVGDGYSTQVHVPTFYLHSNVQGIVSTDHAERIATTMLAEIGREGDDIRVYATEMN